MTAREVARRHEARIRAVDRELRQAARGIAISARKLSREKMVDGIYSQPIPKGKNGKPLWKRTRLLFRSETYEIEGPTRVLIVNTAPYAVERHEAGKPGRRRVRYVSHWQTEMAAVMRDLAVEIWRDAVYDGLRLRRGG